MLFPKCILINIYFLARFSFIIILVFSFFNKYVKFFLKKGWDNSVLNEINANNTISEIDISFNLPDTNETFAQTHGIYVYSMILSQRLMASPSLFLLRVYFLYLFSLLFALLRSHFYFVPTSFNFHEQRYFFVYQYKHVKTFVYLPLP